MQRINTSNVAVDLFGPGKPGFTAGNPSAGVRPTYFSADWCNQVQEELCALPELLGMTMDGSSRAQLAAAIQKLFQSSTPSVGVDTGAANAYVVAFVPALQAPVAWAPFWIKVKTTNTGQSTLNATGTPYGLVGGAHAALQGGEMAAGGWALIYWNPTLNSGNGQYVLAFCTGAPEQVAPATAGQHAAQLGQLQSSAANVGIDTGAANAYVVAFSPALNAPVAWAPFWIKVKTTNTGQSTLNATGTPYGLVGGAHAALQGGEMAAGGWALIYWNPTLNSGNGQYVLAFCTGAPEQVALATAGQHAAQLGQMQSSAANVGIDTGAANAYVVAFSPALNAPVAWAPFWIKVKTTNTGASTLNATGTPYGLVGGAHAALQGNEMVAGGWALIYWNPTLNSGNGQYVLAFCTGAAAQLAAGSYGVTPAANDNSTKLSTTAWIWNNIQSLVQSCIANVATAMGFSYSFGASGYFKFPSWLASLMFQWGAYSTGAAGVVVNFPLTFPTVCYGVVVTANVTSSTVPGAVDSVNGINTSNFNVDGWQTGTSNRSAHPGNYWAWGK